AAIATGFQGAGSSLGGGASVPRNAYPTTENTETDALPRSARNRLPRVKVMPAGYWNCRALRCLRDSVPPTSATHGTAGSSTPPPVHGTSMNAHAHSSNFFRRRVVGSVSHTSHPSFTATSAGGASPP